MLKDCFELITNNENCVILKVKEDKKMELIGFGCFNLDENMFRITKGSQHCLTVFKDDNSSWSVEWGNRACTCVTENTNRKKFALYNCIETQFGIPME